MSNSIAASAPLMTLLKPLQALNEIDVDWEIQALGFVNDDKNDLGGLCELKTIYRNGNELVFK